MMMAALEAGGLNAVRSDERDQMNKVFGDADYEPNGRGFYELPGREVNTPGFPKQHEGKLIKVMYSNVALIAPMQYKVVFMRRNSEEIRQSFEAAFGTVIPDMKKYDEAVDAVVALCNNRKDMEVVELQYRDVIDAPEEAFSMLWEHGWPIDVPACAGKVDGTLCRFRIEELSKGI